MANTHGISGDMQVLGSDGGMVGRVDGVEGDRIKLKRAAEAGGGQHHFIPTAWVSRVDDHVHLDRPAASVRDQWSSEGTHDGRTGAATGSEVRTDAYDRKSSNWLIWVAIAVLVLVALYVLVNGLGYAS